MDLYEKGLPPVALSDVKARREAQKFIESYGKLEKQDMTTELTTFLQIIYLRGVAAGYDRAMAYKPSKKKKQEGEKS